MISETHPNAEHFPKGVSGPALRAMHHAGVKSLKELAKWTEADLLALHGMGPKAIRVLKRALARQKRHFRRA